MNRSYSELMMYDSLEDRFEYLSLDGVVAEITFGNERYVNQQFYRSEEWKRIRRMVTVRDFGRDLGVYDRPIRGAYPIVHHINPITLQDLEDGSDALFDMENLISTSLNTHNAIHYGNKELLPQPFVERTPGDTMSYGRR